MPLTISIVKVVLVTAFLPIDIIKSTDLTVTRKLAPFSASQSSTKSTFNANNAIDGKMDTYSHTLSGSKSESGSEAWLRIQLGRNFSVSKVVI